MRFVFGDGFVEGIPGEGDEKVIQAYLKPALEEPVCPKLSSTVMLVRDSVPGQTPYRIEDGVFPEAFPSNQNVEVFMLRRAKTMAFVPDAVVFPGGSVDVRDANPDLPWFGPSPAEWASLMCCSESDARLAIVAAAREVFEEAGVLLAGPDGGSTVQTAHIPEWQDIRHALARHERSFADVLIEHGLVLRADLLGLVGELQTPAAEPRRYDTYFFSALMPEGQAADGETSEAQAAEWVTPAYALRQREAGAWRVVPPTLMNLTKIAEAHDAASFVQTRRKVSRCTLHVEYVDKAGDVCEPDAAEAKALLRWHKTDRLLGNRSDFDAEGNYHPID